MTGVAAEGEACDDKQEESIDCVLPHRLREHLKISEQPAVISIAGGLTAAEVFPPQRIAELLVSRARSGKACTAHTRYLEKADFLPLTCREVQLNGLRCATSSGHGQNYSGSPGYDVAARKNAFAGSALSDCIGLDVTSGVRS